MMENKKLNKSEFFGIFFQEDMILRYYLEYYPLTTNYY